MERHRRRSEQEEIEDVDTEDEQSEEEDHSIDDILHNIAEGGNNDLQEMLIKRPVPIFGRNKRRRIEYAANQSRKERLESGELIFMLICVYIKERKLHWPYRRRKVTLMLAFYLLIYVNLQKTKRIRSPGDNVALRNHPSMLNNLGARRYFRLTWDELKIINAKFIEEFNLGPVLKYTNGYVWESLYALALVCYRLSFPKRMLEMEAFWGISASKCSTIFNDYIAKIHILFHTSCSSLNVELIKDRLSLYVAAIERFSNGVIDNAWGLVDGTNFYVSRPSNLSAEYANLMYYGKEKQFCLKYLGCTTPDGLVVLFGGPFRGAEHDATTFQLLDLETSLSSIRLPNGRIANILTDSAFAQTATTTTAFRRDNTSTDFQWINYRFNEILSSTRVPVEWTFGGIYNIWSSTGWKVIMRTKQTPWILDFAVLMFNFRMCLRQSSQVSRYFGVVPPSFDYYFESLKKMINK